MALVTKLTNGIIGQVATISTEGSETSGTGIYSIEYEFGSLTGVIKDNISPQNVPTTIRWTIPTSFYDEIPDTTSKTGKLISYYYTRGNKMVNSTSTFIAKIPDSDVPTITASVVTTDALSSQLSGNTSTIINGVSNVKVTMSATPTQGSTMVNQYFYYQRNYYPMNIQNTISLTGGYDGVFDFGAIDTRSRKRTSRITLTAIDYRTPTIAIDDVSISTSGVATINITGTWFNGSFGATANTLTVQYRYKSSSSSSWGSWTTISNVTKNSDGTYSATASKSGLSYNNTYNFEARVIDKINTVSSKEYTGKSLPVFDWSKDDFNFNVPVSILSPTDSNNPATKKYVDDLTEVISLAVQDNTDNIAALSNQISNISSTIFDNIYPVGSIYMSVNNTNPSNLFGGTWTQLKDRFLLGAGSTYTNGSTGGSATQRLSAANLPSHTHPQYVATNGGSTSANLDYNGWVSNGKAVAQGIPTGATGQGTTFDIMPPYLVVYMWQRTG